VSGRPRRKSPRSIWKAILESRRHLLVSGHCRGSLQNFILHVSMKTTCCLSFSESYFCCINVKAGGWAGYCGCWPPAARRGQQVTCISTTLTHQICNFLIVMCVTWQPDWSFLNQYIIVAQDWYGGEAVPLVAPAPLEHTDPPEGSGRGPHQQVGTPPKSSQQVLRR
jgi:hypothetical protein